MSSMESVMEVCIRQAAMLGNQGDLMSSGVNVARKTMSWIGSSVVVGEGFSCVNEGLPKHVSVDAPGAFVRSSSFLSTTWCLNRSKQAFLYVLDLEECPSSMKIQ